MSGFTGFSPKTIAFLRELGRVNTKEWFAAHKGEYQEHLLAPFAALVRQLTPAMLAIDPLFETGPVVGKTLSRMHRDVRFSKDKRPYRDRMWLVFKRPGEGWQERPGYFFELNPESVIYGVGYYMASRQTMERLRVMLEKQPDAFRRQAAVLEGSPFSLEGEKYKRPKNPDLPEDLREWSRFKTFYLIRFRDLGDFVYSADLAADLAREFSAVAPFYRFMWDLAAGAE